MKHATLLGLWLSVTGAAVLAACGEAGITGPNSVQATIMDSATPAAPLASAVPGTPTNHQRVDLTGCEQLGVPIGSKLTLRVHAVGFQVYRWTGSDWGFVGPVATLFADAGARGAVGTHYAGPTWEHKGGGKVVGAVLQRCTKQTDAIPWLLLRIVTADGAGPFADAQFIQRVNTAGGNAPQHPGQSVGDEAMVPYTTDYLFYR